MRYIPVRFVLNRETVNRSRESFGSFESYVWVRHSLLILLEPNDHLWCLCGLNLCDLLCGLNLCGLLFCAFTAIVNLIK